MSTPKISIILPVYNTENYLDMCLQSVLGQSFDDYELLIVDDGSTDRSSAMLDAYAAKDARIHVFHQENGGVSAARNAAIAEAIGDYLFFLDSDDYMSPDALRLLYAAAVETDADVVAGGYRFFGTQELERPGIDAVMDGATFLSRYFSIVSAHFGYPSWGKLFRRALIMEHGIRYNTEQKKCEDHTFNVACYRYVQKVTLIPYIVYNYNSGNAGSITRRTDANYGHYRMLEFATIYQWVGDHPELLNRQAAEAILCCLNVYVREYPLTDAAVYMETYYRELQAIYDIPISELNRQLGVKLLSENEAPDWHKAVWIWYRKVTRRERFRSRLYKIKVRIFGKRSLFRH